MFGALKRRMRRFMTVPSGQRFRAFYHRHHQRPHLARTIVSVGAGLALIAVGLVLLVLPGPGLLVGAFGAALLAGESLTVARALDWIDLRLTRLWRRLRHKR
jgi:Putative transmembrane protein (PGPGW)